MKKAFNPYTFALRLTLSFIVFIATLSTLNAQQNQLRYNRYEVWEDMIEKNNVYISTSFGLGSYKMNGMRDLQQNLISFYGINALKNSDFPPFWLYSLSISRQYDSTRFGLSFDQMSTGSRYSISDYSGKYISDLRCNAYKIGVFIEKDFSFKIKNIKNLGFGYRIESGGLGSTILQQTEISINNMEDGTMLEYITLKNVSPFVEPTIFVNWEIIRKLFMQFSTGYLLDLPSSIKLGTLPETKIEWAGYRLKLGLIKQF